MAIYSAYVVVETSFKQNLAASKKEGFSDIFLYRQKFKWKEKWDFLFFGLGVCFFFLELSVFLEKSLNTTMSVVWCWLALKRLATAVLLSLANQEKSKKILKGWGKKENRLLLLSACVSITNSGKIPYFAGIYK